MEVFRRFSFAIREKLENFAFFFAKRLRNLKGLLVVGKSSLGEPLAQKEPLGPQRSYIPT